MYLAIASDFNPVQLPRYFWSTAFVIDEFLVVVIFLFCCV